MKSPALAEAPKPLHQLQKPENLEWQAAHDAWAIDMKLLALQSADQRNARQLTNKDPRAARALLEAFSMPEEPASRRFTVNDATVEKLGELLQVNPRAFRPFGMSFTAY